MGIFGKAKTRDEPVLLFDIGSSSVKSALFYMQKSGIPRIVTTLREPIMLEENIDIDRFLFLTIQALQTVVDKIHHKRLGAPSRIFCILSSPWHISQTRIISLKKNTPFTFNSQIADNLIQKEIALLQEEYLKKYSHIGDILRPIELKNIKVTLNGYETQDPLYKKTQEVEMTVFISMTPEQVCQKIEETISKHFPGNRERNGVKFSSFTMASFTTVRDLYKNQQNFLLISIGGEITDIALVKGNTLHESTSFPLGINFMIRAVASSLNCSLAEAKSLILLFKDGHADARTAKILEPVITKLKADWLSKFQESLANLSRDISIPAFVYITLDKDLADFFREVIKTEQFNQYTLTESKFQIIFLNVDNLQGISTFQQDAIFNAFLSIDCSYVNRFFANYDLAGKI